MSEITAFANRLGKNAKHLIKWACRQNIEAWRLYDRDIPQYPFAIDIYGNHAHLQEYDTGWIMQHAEYEAWLAEVVEAVQFITGFPAEHIHLKQRSRQRGSSQYEKTGRNGEDFIVHENGRAFWVNLDKYLDTGLFLDHRNTRALVGSEAQGKRFLNLFSYTGSFSVYAATGGAASSETVDLSNTYLDWARRNFELNRINPEQHRIIREAMRLLEPGGTLYFSNNLRSFELEPAVAEHYAVAEISRQSVPEDFRNRKIHRCWTIKHR